MKKAPDTAMLLAAGRGVRMQPLTLDTPKPLIRVAGKALIDYCLERFAAAGVKKIVVNVHHLADQVEAHLANFKEFEIAISDERTQLLETGGGLKKARPLFNADAIYCANTDAILIDADGSEACGRLSQSWRPEIMDALLLLSPVEETSGYNGAGDFTMGTEGRIAFRAGQKAPFVFTGLQIISTPLIDKGPEGPFSTKLLWERAAERGRLFGVTHKGFWLHAGDVKGLEAAERYLSGAG